MSVALRARLHAALDAFLDALDEYRAAPVEDELVKLADVRIEAKARTRLVREGKLRVVRIGRSLYTRRSYVSALVDQLPAFVAPTSPRHEYDALVDAVRRRAQRRARRGAR